MPLCAAQRGPLPTPALRTATCEMLLCCLVSPQLEHLPLDPLPPSNPSSFSSIQPEQGARSLATLCRLFRRTSEKEKQIEATGGDNETAGWATAVHFARYFLSHCSAGALVVCALISHDRQRHNAGPCLGSMSGPRVPCGAEFLSLVFSNPVSVLLTGEKSPASLPHFSEVPCQSTQLWISALHHVTDGPNTSQLLVKTTCQSISLGLQT